MTSRYILLFAILIQTLSLAACTQTEARREPGDPNFVYVHEEIPGVLLDVRYFSDDNFMGTRVDGYHDAVILIARPTARALSGVQADLNKQGLGLKVFDGYRPQKAVNHFMRWAEDPADILTKTKYYPDLPKDRLFDLGYISRKSGHTRGGTLDLTVVDLATGKDLDMGSPWDFFGDISHHDSPLVGATATANRDILRNVMVKHGFRAATTEWWHYTLVDEPYPDTYFDFDVE